MALSSATATPKRALSATEHVEDMEAKEKIEIPTHERYHLVPRPSERPEDPLNWPLSLKIGILLQVCWLAALGTWNTSVINPAYAPLSADLHIPETHASYQTTIAIALNGFGPFIWIPLANVYGRRFVYLATTIIGFATALACGFVHNFGSLIAIRAINGIFPVSMALGPATITDLFFYHQRGRALGCFTVFLTSGSHFAGLFGGPVGQFLGWRWIFWITAVMNFVTLVVIVFCLPETVYYTPRTYDDASSEAWPRLTADTYRKLLAPWRTYPGVRLKAKHFFLPPFRMARYPSVIFPALYYATQYCFTAIFPAVTYATIFHRRFGWNTLQCGLAYGGTMTIGSILGEFAAGRIIDKILAREAKRLGTDNPPPEVRFKGLWAGAVLVPVGLLVFGFSMQYPAHWSGALAGMFIGIFGIQIVATVCYTYSIDCYRIEGSEVSQLFNFVRQETSFTVGFYGVQLCLRIGYQFAFLMFALVGSVLAFAPVVFLMWKGPSMRERLGRPQGVSVAEEVLRDHEEFYRQRLTVE
ncbi:Major facilitator superfamily domain, general substrate transporter [Niveomyces insectorum RCEF 264]|uniref:Major facilitator superfamily domain, general substrate transporter n=1 Tax=Niveomyces insectorum RCEF 264 TaxID=1081102 RepID=A0A168AEE4_9HYPO|nr:Major facilitator superfamily domain, general substrate transporter [Niveomyces insectorum RCEF 264]